MASRRGMARRERDETVEQVDSQHKAGRPPPPSSSNDRPKQAEARGGEGWVPGPARPLRLGPHVLYLEEPASQSGNWDDHVRLPPMRLL